MSHYKPWNVFGGCLVKTWINGVQFEDQAAQQVEDLAQLPFVGPHVAIMPDCHAGKGSVVGSVIPTLGAVVPSFVGVDIGCGMRFCLTNLKVGDLEPGTYPSLREALEKAVPHGRTDNGGKNDRGAWGDAPWDVVEAWDRMADEYMLITNKTQALDHAQALSQLGTLGTGNHFLEICVDELDRIWVVVHSGSRGVGARIGSVFTKAAKALMEKWFIKLPDSDLAYLPEGTPEFSAYVQALNWAQNYAYQSRKIMVDRALQVLRNDHVNAHFLVQNDCHHNYLSRERHLGKDYWITRKGAVRARETDTVIIPGSMGARSYICRGLGNRDSFTSCSHGAGRAMSRTQARKQFTVEDHIQATAGIECRKDADVIDETPGSYKNIDAVMEAQKDLVEIKHTLRQIICVKG